MGLVMGAILFIGAVITVINQIESMYDRFEKRFKKKDENDAGTKDNRSRD